MVIKNERKKYLITILLIPISAMLSVLIYVLCLRQIPSIPPFSFYYREDYWAVYLADLVGTVGVGIFFSAALTTKLKIWRQLCSAMAAGCVVLYGFILYGMGCGSYSIKQRFEALLVSIWPFITYGVALLLKKLFRRNHKINGVLMQQILAIGLYYLVIFAGVAYMQGMILSEFYRWEPLKMIYLMTVAALSWKLTQLKTEDLQWYETGSNGETVPQSEKNIVKRNTDKWISMLTAGMPTVITIVILVSNERVRDILTSLKNPITAIQGAQMETNWLGNRLALMMGAWRGDFSLLDEPFIAKIAVGSPLLWVNFVQGYGMAFFLLLLSIMLLCSLLLLLNWKQTGKKQPFLQLLGTVLILRSCIGIAADLLVLTTTDVGLLLLRNPGDVILVIYVVMSAMQGFRSSVGHRPVDASNEVE